MADSDFEGYRKYVQANLEKMIALFAHISNEDYSIRVNLDGLGEDEFTQAFCGLDLMMDDLIELREKYRHVKGQLEKQVRDRTVELVETNEQLLLDIKERQKAEAELVEREKFLTEVFSSIQDPISVLDTTLTIVRVNSAMEKWFFGKMPITGKKCYWVYHNRETPCVNCPSIRTIATGISSTEVVNKCDAQGNKIGWSEVNAFPWRDAGSEKILGVIEHVRDVTDRVRLENELFKIKKLESLGVLAGGIAHDFNNILMGIVANVSLARTKAAADPAVSDLLREAEKASLRAGKLVRQLLTFSKGGVPVKEIVSINEIIEEATGFCLSGTNVRYTLQLLPGLRPVEADRSQIDQVLNNLIINAAQAMPQGGTVVISSENVALDAVSIAADRQLAVLRKGDYVKVIVRDEGVGVPRENFEKIFDPYFTTKEKGTGLGLAIAYSIINRHHGAITVDSNVGAGTSFSFFLPASGETVVISQKKKAVSATSGGGRVLVLDDDRIVRLSIEKLLGHAGFDTVGTASGEETVAVYAEAFAKGDRFDFVIMDLTIPGGMGGKDAVVKVLQINPEAIVIVASGYSSDPVLADYRNYGFRGAIPKPFQLDELLTAMEKAKTN